MYIKEIVANFTLTGIICSPNCPLFVSSKEDSYGLLSQLPRKQKKVAKDTLVTESNIACIMRVRKIKTTFLDFPTSVYNPFIFYLT